MSSNKTTLKRLFQFVLFFLTFHSFAYSASFDCNKATTPIEKLICSDTTISSLDEQLAKMYKITIKNNPNAANIRKQQKEWLTSKRATCTEKKCLTDQYLSRITEIQNDYKPLKKIKVINDLSKYNGNSPGQLIKDEYINKTLHAILTDYYDLLIANLAVSSGAEIKNNEYLELQGLYPHMGRLEDAIIVIEKSGFFYIAINTQNTDSLIFPDAKGVDHHGNVVLYFTNDPLKCFIPNKAITDFVNWCNQGRPDPIPLIPSWWD